MFKVNDFIVRKLVRNVCKLNKSKTFPERSKSFVQHKEKTKAKYCEDYDNSKSKNRTKTT